MSDVTERAASRNTERMMYKKNVVGVAGGEDRVLVLVTQKEPLSALSVEDVVDREVEGVRTDVVEVGQITPKLGAGDSIGTNLAGTGTVGGIVVDEMGIRYILTNNHVAAGSNLVPMLTPVHSPGPADGLGSTVGVLSRYEPIYFDCPNFVDAALVRLNDAVTVEHYYEPSTTTGRTGWEVWKRGRTTGWGQGEILARNATVDVDFGAQGIARFVGQLVTTHMLDPGDSGSVLLSTSRHPIGLGFAGSETVSLHTPINYVLRTLAVSFEAG